MPNLSAGLRPIMNGLRELRDRAFHASRLGQLVRTPPLAWSMRSLARLLLRPVPSATTQPALATERTTSGELQATLHDIVDDVVQAMGYNVAMVALYEQGDSLAIHAIQFDPAVLTHEKIQSWERQLSALIGRPVGITDPVLARTYIFREQYANNLSVKAAHSQRPLVSDALFDLFTPITPDFTRPLVDAIQRELGISQVIAVPFFLETSLNGQPTREMVGNLFAARPQPITQSDIALLSAFGRQAAAAILNERQRIQIELAQALVLKIQHSLQDEHQLLQHIVQGVVVHMGFMGAMVTTYEPDGALPLRAFFADPAMIPPEQVTLWEEQLAELVAAERLGRLSASELPYLYVNRPEYQANLGVRAIQSGSYEVGASLYEIFTPIIPVSVEPTLAAIQEQLEIRQVIAMPFFLERMLNGAVRREPVGTLFTVTRSRSFRAGEIELLQAFGQQAAAGLHNARLYRQSEARRAAAQLFGRMAFSASASIHQLKNHIGAIRLPLQLINMALSQPAAFPEDERQRLLANLQSDSELFQHLDAAANLLNTLHEPWRHLPDRPCDVNDCLRKALEKVMPKRPDWVYEDLAPELPPVHTAPPMLTEAFKILIKNAFEAISAAQRPPHLELISRLQADSTILVTISDNGVGIRPEHLSHIFEMRWSTKPSGLGFGLFWTHDYIQGLNGELWVESTWQQGTTVSVRLPVSQVRQAAPESST